MKTIWHFLSSAVLGIVGIVLVLAFMLAFKTAPAVAFAYLLFFTVLRSISVMTISRERVIEFGTAWIVCIAASFWVLRSDAPMVWDRQDGGVYSVLWRSAVFFVCILAIPRCASYLALRSIKPLRTLGA